MAMIIALCYERLDWKTIEESAFGAIKTTAMITLIIVCAQMMSMSMSMLRTPSMLADMLASLKINRWLVMMVICLLYIGLGCVLEALSMFLLTIPVVYPIILALNFDPIWFGVMAVLMMEAGLITPPMGLNIFTVAGVVKDVPIEDIFRGTIPFLLSIFAVVILITIFPKLAIFLPSMMFR
jgi:TRAP-type C4-dicarboxylate transport system permease large subunit